MPRLHLSDLAIAQLSASRQTDYWDAKTPGFGVRVGPRSKTFIANIGKTRQTLGRYPYMTLKEARAEAKRLSFLNHHGNIPPRTQDAVTLFLTSRDQINRPSTAAETRRHLTKHFTSNQYFPHTGAHLRNIRDQLGNIDTYRNNPLDFVDNTMPIP